MRTRGVVALALFAAFALLQMGCASSIAPSGWLPSAREAQQEAYGAWIDMEAGDGGVDPGRGELLAIGEDSVFTVAENTVTATALALVLRAKLEVYSPRSGPAAGLTLLGVLISPTAGVFAVATAPLWVIVGTASTAVLSRQGKHSIDARQPAGGTPGAEDSGAARESWRGLRIYARFPQGMPPGLNRKQLHERPRPGRSGQ